MNVPRETLTGCPVCGGNYYSPFLICTDYNASQEKFDIVECSDCGMRFTQPRPAESEIGTYYKFTSYISHTNRSGGLMGLIYRLVRRYTLGRKIELVKKFAGGNTLLEIGCGTGYFSAKASRSGFTVTAIEPDEDARNFAIKQNGVKAFPADALHTLSEKFDVIVLWHVLEHVYHLQRDCARIEQLLAPGGVLIVAVPDCRSYDAAYYSLHWAGYDVPRHLYHFSQPQMELLWKRYSFSTIAVKPMRFDAYYVSMLSQGHLGRGKWCGFRVGWKSNRSAARGATPWSSQIYILRRH